MHKKTLITVGILLVLSIGAYIFLGGYTEQRFFSEGFVNDKKPQDPIITETKVISNPFALKDLAGDFSFISDNNFNFEMSGDEILRPVSKDIITGIAEMQLYFGANETRRVGVTGLYTSSEKNTSGFPNLGLGRANAVKEYLIIQGIPSSRINLFGTLSDTLKPDGRIYRGPVTFSITESTYNSEENNPPQ
jgi:hypothetical protein